MNNYILQEAKDFPGFYEIPTYSWYVINKDGLIFNKFRKKFLAGSTNPDGYINFRLTGDNKICYTWGLHRLLAFVFKNPGCDIKDLVVNHINAIKSDNSLDNLEWCTYQKNAEHAGSLGLTSKCSPISVRDIYTGHIEKFPSIIECARAYGVSKDTINWRSKKGEHYIFPEGKQYRLSYNDDPWNTENNILQNGTAKCVSMKHVLTGVIMEFNKISDLSTYLNVPQSTLTLWLNCANQPVLPGFIQLKYKTDITPWRYVKNPYLELNSYTGKKSVKTINDLTGEIKMFSSAIECSKEMNISATALNYRLKSNGTKVFSDGNKYSYL